MTRPGNGRFVFTPARLETLKTLWEAGVDAEEIQRRPENPAAGSSAILRGMVTAKAGGCVMSDDLVDQLKANPTYDDRSDADDLIEAQAAEIARLRAALKWSIERDGDDLLICEGNHERHEGCTMQRWVKAENVATARNDALYGFGGLVEAALAEAIKAMRKYPQPNYVISKIAEESGEVVKAAIHCAENRETAENVAAEMKQLIAMLIRIWIEGDQVHGLPPIAPAIRAMKDREP